MKVNERLPAEFVRELVRFNKSTPNGTYEQFANKIGLKEKSVRRFIEIGIKRGVKCPVLKG